MVCGLCHREDQDHADSTSGPTRCKYQSHRPECPGGFRTTCETHLEQLKEQKLNPDDKNDIKPVDSPKPESSENDLAKKLQGLLTPQQIQAILNPEEKPQFQQTPNNSDNPHLTSQAPDTLQAALPPNLLSGLDMLARQHVADNQQHLLGQMEQKTTYTGPLMADIRKDSDTQDKVSLVVDALKNITPVFGQTATPTPALQGISPLVQLQQQLSSGNPTPSSNIQNHTYTPQPLLQQLYDSF